jgi:hypothetical protein
MVHKKIIPPPSQPPPCLSCLSCSPLPSPPFYLPSHVDCWVPPPPTPARWRQRCGNTIATTTPPLQGAHPNTNLQKPRAAAIKLPPSCRQAAAAAAAKLPLPPPQPPSCRRRRCCRAAATLSAVLPPPSTLHCRKAAAAAAAAAATAAAATTKLLGTMKKDLDWPIPDQVRRVKTAAKVEVRAPPVEQNQQAPIKMVSRRAWSPGIYWALRLLCKSLDVAWERAFIWPLTFNL